MKHPAIHSLAAFASSSAVVAILAWTSVGHAGLYLSNVAGSYGRQNPDYERISETATGTNVTRTFCYSIPSGTTTASKSLAAVYFDYFLLGTEDTQLTFSLDCSTWYGSTKSASGGLVRYATSANGFMETPVNAGPCAGVHSEWDYIRACATVFTNRVDYWPFADVGVVAAYL